MRFISSLLVVFLLLSLVSLSYSLTPRATNLNVGFLKPRSAANLNPPRIRPFWGQDGHAAVAAIAQTLISSATFTALQQLLPEVDGQMADIASWADQVRDLENYYWSKPLHFANTPSWQCNYDRKRDCLDPVYGVNMCVDMAIQNYTARAVNTQLGFTQQNEAMKFLIHFVGDVHQPLHCGFTQDEGGNTIQGTYENEYTELHAVWDSRLLYTRIDREFGGSNATWVHNMIQQVNAMPPSTIKEWQTCLTTGVPFQACSQDWANESVKLACSNSYVEADGITHIQQNFNLSDPYFHRNIPVVESQIMKGAVRLAYVLNNMFAQNEETRTGEISIM